MSLSGIGIGPLTSSDWFYSTVVTVPNSVTETTVSATISHTGASYAVKLGGVVDEDGVISLRVGENAITIIVTAEDGLMTRVFVFTVTREGTPVGDFEENQP